MRTDEKVIEKVTGIRAADIEAAFDPAEADGVHGVRAARRRVTEPPNGSGGGPRTAAGADRKSVV